MNAHSLATLATVSASGAPHAASVYYTVDHDLNLYFVTREETTKYSNIKRNPQVSVVITDEETAETVQIQGTAQKITDEPVISDILEQLWKITVEKSHWPSPAVKLNKGSLSIIKVVPAELKFGDFKPVHLADGSDYFQEVI